MARMELTGKQLAFAQHYAIHGDGAAAYRACYDVSPDAKNATCTRNAKHILDNPAVLAKLAEIRQPAADAVGLTLKTHLEKLEELRNAAAEAGQHAAAITAEISRGKAVGLYIDRKQVTGDGTGVIVQMIMGSGSKARG